MFGIYSLFIVIGLVPSFRTGKKGAESNKALARYENFIFIYLCKYIVLL